MKRYMKNSKSECSNISFSDIIQYLEYQACDECTLSADDLKSMAEEIQKCLYNEEMMTGECYESIEDADIPELCDAATTSLHDMYYNLIFGPMK